LLELADAEQFGAERFFVRQPNGVLPIESGRRPPQNSLEGV
jgi:hypothetical protein